MDDNDFSREISKSVTSQLNLLVSNDSFDGVIFFAGKVQIFWGMCFALVYIKFYGLDEPIAARIRSNHSSYYSHLNSDMITLGAAFD